MENLSIGVVARMTGLSEFTLRAWERRYCGLAPKRLKSGRRIYSLSDVERLNLIGQLLTEGHKVSSIIDLNTAKLAELVRHRKGSAANNHGPGASPLSVRRCVNKMLDAVRELDVKQLVGLLKVSQMQFNTQTLLIDIIALFLRDLGQAVAKGQLDVFHEHVASAGIRNFLTGILFSTEQVANFISAPPIIFAAPEGDHHEFGILMAAILAAMHSHPVLYLGPNMPFGSLERATRKTKSTLVVIGMTAPETEISDKAAQDYVKNISSRLESPTQIWIGGSRSLDLRIRGDLKRVTTISTLNEFDRKLCKFSTPSLPVRN